MRHTCVCTVTCTCCRAFCRRLLSLLFILRIYTSHILYRTVLYCTRCVIVQLYWYYFCVANCTSTWVETSHNEAVHHNGEHVYTSASTLKQCQEACEFDPRCVAIDWQVVQGQLYCVIFTNPNHEHRDTSYITSTHYELVSRCNISTGHFVVFCLQ